MSWKNNIQVRDMDDGMRLECRCVKCNHVHYITKASICVSEEKEFFYLDEIEAAEVCKRRGCSGRIEIFIIESRKTSSFVGGLA